MTNSCSPLIAEAMSFPIEDVLERYQRDYEVSQEVAIEHGTELKRFLILAALHPEASYSMKGPIDDLWHTFILFTRNYHAFCRGLCGYYIHHDPKPLSMEVITDLKQEDDSVIDGYSQFYNDYESFFGSPPPASCWPQLSLVAQGACDASCGCSSGPP